MAEKNKKKKKKKQGNTDTITVLFVFALIIILAIGVSVVHYSNENNINKASTHKQKEKEQQETTNFILALGGVSVAVVGLFVGVKIKNKRKKKKLLLEKQRKLKEIEEARQRVEAAKYSAILNAGNSVLKDRADAQRILDSQQSKIKHKYDFNELDDDLLGDEDDEFDNGEALSRRRRNIYRDYDDIDNRDIEEEFSRGKFEVFNLKNKPLSKRIFIIATLLLVGIIIGVVITLFLI